MLLLLLLLFSLFILAFAFLINFHSNEISDIRQTFMVSAHLILNRLVKQKSELFFHYILLKSTVSALFHHLPDNLSLASLLRHASNATNQWLQQMFFLQIRFFISSP